MCVTEIGFQFYTPSTKEDILKEIKRFEKNHFIFLNKNNFRVTLGNDAETGLVFDPLVTYSATVLIRGIASVFREHR